MVALQECDEDEDEEDPPPLHLVEDMLDGVVEMEPWSGEQQPSATDRPID